MKTTSLLLFIALLLTPAALRAGEFESAFRKNVGEFLNLLDAQQAKACLLPLDDDKNRLQRQYTGGKRPGVEISKLNAQQRAAMEKALRMVLSDHGWKMANRVAKQDGPEGLAKYWITCFGDPRQQGDFAFRIAEHHLTVVHLEVAEGETKEFGPILLGANPATLWKNDELALLDVWKKIADRKVLIADKGAIASRLMPMDEGALFSSLNADAQAALKSAWNQRLSIFTTPIQKRIKALHAERGGWEKSRVAYYNQTPEKRSIDGGRWDFKSGLPGMVWDYEASRGHIHMSLWVKALK